MVQQFDVQSKSIGPGSASDRRHRRDSVVAIPSQLDWPMSFGCPHSSPQRLQQKATFIEENDASFSFEALFLTAAIRRGANGQSPVRPFLAPVARGFEDSTRPPGEAAGRSLDDSRHRTVDGSDLAPRDQSIPTTHSPSDVSLATATPPNATAVRRTISLPDHDAVSVAVCRLVARPFATERLKRHLNQLQQPLPSATFPSQKAGLRFSDGLRAIRGFLWVSY
jgi:hypothetical protein